MKVPIRDGSFYHALSMSTGGETLSERPTYFDWERKSQGEQARFYTDVCVSEVEHMPKVGLRVAVLIEAPPFRTRHYQEAERLQAHYDYILTYNRTLLEKYRGSGKWLFYPHCGSRIPLEKWFNWPKTKMVSMIASDKQAANGHRFRHEIAAKFGNRIDVLGSIRGAAISKFDGHSPYRYSIVVCGERLDWGFSDHLIDCLSTWTVPIYWGCPEIGKFFDLTGIIPFEKADDLPAILDSLSAEDYEVRLPAIRRNFDVALEYRLAEDWLFLNYPFLFEGLE